MQGSGTCTQQPPTGVTVGRHGHSSGIRTPACGWGHGPPFRIAELTRLWADVSPWFCCRDDNHADPSPPIGEWGQGNRCRFDLHAVGISEHSDQNCEILTHGSSPGAAGVAGTRHSGVHRAPSNQAGSTPISQVGPKPVQHDRHAIASAREEQHVGQAPEPPGWRPPQPKPADLHDGCESANGGEISIVAVLESPRHLVPVDGCPDHVGNVPPLLLCRGGQAGDASAHPPIRRGGVADCEYAEAAGDS